MASAPLIDFETTDLSEVVATREDIRELLKQRGRLEMLDGILLFDTESTKVVGYKEIRGDDWWAADHVPGRPLFPGALMIETAAQLCSYDYMRRAEVTPDHFVGFGGLGDTHFRGTVEPDCRMIFVGETRRIRSRMFIYYCQGFVDRKLVFETEVKGVVV